MVFWSCWIYPTVGLRCTFGPSLASFRPLCGYPLLYYMHTAQCDGNHRLLPWMHLCESILLIFSEEKFTSTFGPFHLQFPLICSPTNFVIFFCFIHFQIMSYSSVLFVDKLFSNLGVVMTLSMKDAAGFGPFVRASYEVFRKMKHMILMPARGESILSFSRPKTPNLQQYLHAMRQGWSSLSLV